MNDSKNSLRSKIYDGERIGEEEALALFTWDLIDLAKAADMRRKAIFPGEEVGFIVDRIINYTNICEARCSFCAYHAKAGRIEAYELDLDEITRRVSELIKIGGSQIMLQGGLHPDYRLDHYLGMVRTVKERFPEVFIHSFSPAEIVHISRTCSLSLAEVIGALKEAGLDSVPGASDLLVERIRKKVSPKKITAAEWCEVMHVLHQNGMMSSATMTYGMGETLAERIEHLSVIRGVQDQTGILRAFIPWSFSPARTKMDHLSSATGMDYLKIVSIARIYLDNITYFQAGWLTEGMKLAQLALTMGANDMGGVLMEEVVVKATGVETKTNIEQMIDVIRNAGKIPVKRDSAYRVIRKYQ
jgi:cyclic dehypoxanthinyl futalosine synthase